MAGQIALVGGDEFRAGCEEMDRGLLRATGVGHPRVLIVPTAAANGVSYFSGLGAEAAPLMVLGRDTAYDERCVSRLGDADMVYFTGGDPDHLMETLKASPFLEGLRRALARGAIVAGSSVGAMVIGSWMSYRGWKAAIGLLQRVAVLAHHERSDPDRVAEEIRDSAPGGIAVLGLDGRTCCFGGTDGWEALGAGTVTLYSGGAWQRYHSGDAVPLQAAMVL